LCETSYNAVRETDEDVAILVWFSRYPLAAPLLYTTVPRPRVEQMVSRFEITILFYIFVAAAVTYIALLIYDFLTNNPIVLFALGILTILIIGSVIYNAWGDDAPTPYEYFTELNTVEKYGLITKTGTLLTIIFIIPAFFTDSFNIIWILEIIGISMLLLGIQLEHSASDGEKWNFSE
jgi:hypothetical protein